MRDGEDDDLEIVLLQKGGTFGWKTDCFDDPETVMPLKAFSSADETLLYYKDQRKGDVYFHLS